MDMPAKKVIRLIRGEDFRGLTFFAGSFHAEAWRHVVKDQPLAAALLAN